MCNKAVASKFFSDCYKTQEMCNKAINISPSAIQIVL